MNTKTTTGETDTNGSKLFDLRIRMGLSQKQICDLLHISRSTLWQWESGKREMPEAYWELLQYKMNLMGSIRTAWADTSALLDNALATR